MKKPLINSNKRFRLNAKTLFLTYSQIPQSITRLNILECLQIKAQAAVEYLVALENHEDGGLHAHVLLILNKRCNFKDPNCFDIPFEDKILHGNYQSTRDKKATIAYIVKSDKDYLTNMDIASFKGKLVSPEAYAVYQSKEVGISAALFEYKNKYPERSITKLVQLEKMLKVSERIDNEVIRSSNPIRFKDINFDKVDGANHILAWLKSEANRESLIVSGQSGMGKSLMAKAIMNELKIEAIRITNIQGLKRLKPGTKGIIADDVTTNKLGLTELIHLMDTREPSDTRILYQSIAKPANLTQIFTINDIKKVIPELVEAISRRILLVNLTEPIVNVTINNTTNNNITNNIENQYNTYATGSINNEFAKFTLPDKELTTKNEYTRNLDFEEHNKKVWKEITAKKPGPRPK